MTKNLEKTINYDVLRRIDKNPGLSQRKLASELGYSLGKLNYCLNALKDKGLIKIKNFKSNKNKISYMYLLTPAGISVKTKLTIKFMERKIKAYDELAEELKKVKTKQ